MKKKFLTFALAAAMVVSSAVNVFAALVTENKDYGEGIVVDGSTSWNSAGSGETFPVTEDGVTVVFDNEPFIRQEAANAEDVTNGIAAAVGDMVDRNWFNFVFETIATADCKGLTGRADAYAWTYGDGTQTPTYTTVVNWDWANFMTFMQGEISFHAQKTSDTTVEFTITASDEAGSNAKYIVTYPDGVPADLAFQVGSDGGKITLLSATFGKEETPSEDETEAPSEDETTVPSEDETTAPSEDETTVPSTDDEEESTTAKNPSADNPELESTTTPSTDDEDTSKGEEDASKDDEDASKDEEDASKDEEESTTAATTTTDKVVVDEEEVAKLQESIDFTGLKDKQELKFATITKKEVIEAVKAAVKDILKDKTYVAVDISIYAEGVKVTEQPEGKVEISMKVPSALEKATKVQVYRLGDDNKAVKVGEPVDVDKDGKIKFTTDHFSTYIFADASATDTTNAEPETGDSAPFVAMLAIAAVAGAAVVASKKKVTE